MTMEQARDIRLLEMELGHGLQQVVPVKELGPGRAPVMVLPLLPQRQLREQSEPHEMVQSVGALPKVCEEEEEDAM